MKTIKNLHKNPNPKVKAKIRMRKEVKESKMITNTDIIDVVVIALVDLDPNLKIPTIINTITNKIVITTKIITISHTTIIITSNRQEEMETIDKIIINKINIRIIAILEAMIMVINNIIQNLNWLNWMILIT